MDDSTVVGHVKTNNAAVRIVIEARLDDDGRPVGSTRHGADEPVRFHGWLGLMAELSRLLTDPSADRPRLPAETEEM